MPERKLERTKRHSQYFQADLIRRRGAKRGHQESAPPDPLDLLPVDPLSRDRLRKAWEMGEARQQEDREQEADRAPESDGVVRVEGLITEDAELYRWFGFKAVSAADVKKQLADMDPYQDPLVVRVNSPGGSVYEGAQIAAELEAYAEKHDRHLQVEIVGLCASAATFLLFGADFVRCHALAEVMIHAPWMDCYGDAKTLVRYASRLAEMTKEQSALYGNLLGVDPKVAEALMYEETWYTATKGKDQGFIDEVFGAGMDDKPAEEGAGADGKQAADGDPVGNYRPAVKRQIKAPPPPPVVNLAEAEEQDIEAEGVEFLSEQDEDDATANPEFARIIELAQQPVPVV